MNEEERRRFFRINDDVAMNFSLLDEAFGGDVVRLDTQELNQEFHVSLEMQIRQAMMELRVANPKMAVVLDLLNQKINLIHSADGLSEQGPVLKPTNISACGISFSWHESIKINQIVMLNLYLQPGHDLVRTQAHVAAVNKNMNVNSNQYEPYVIHLDFDTMHSAYQELLIQHIVKRQGYQLRNKADELQ